jgi:hypothetical protein
VLILPLIDLLILVGTGCLGVGFVLKAVNITTHYNPVILGFSSLDFLLMTVVCWVFALTLAARSWVKLHEPQLLERRRDAVHAQARRRVEEYELANGTVRNGDLEEIATRVASGESH